MNRARIAASASVNYPPHDWHHIGGDPSIVNAVNDAKLYLNWGKELSVGRLNLGQDVALVVSDKVGNIPGHHPDWAIETMAIGDKGTRPCGVKLVYRFTHDHAKIFGLPSPAALESAFREDALKMLSVAYERQGPGPEIMRQFEPHMLVGEKHWKATSTASKLEADNRRVNWSDGVKKNSPLPPTTNRRAMIVAGVAIGATLVGYAAWKILRNEKSSDTPSR